MIRSYEAQLPNIKKASERARVHGDLARLREQQHQKNQKNLKKTRASGRFGKLF